jgi:hypothetical protein
LFVVFVATHFSLSFQLSAAHWYVPTYPLAPLAPPPTPPLAAVFSSSFTVFSLGLCCCELLSLECGVWWRKWRVGFVNFFFFWVVVVCSVIMLQSLGVYC